MFCFFKLFFVKKTKKDFQKSSFFFYSMRTPPPIYLSARHGSGASRPVKDRKIL